MQHVVIIPEQEWRRWMDRQEELLKRVERLEKGLTAWVGTDEAERITGLKRKSLDERRKPGGIWKYNTDWKKEGAKVLYNRSSLEAYNDSHKPRRRRA